MEQLVSVIIPIYNSEKLREKCIQSIVEQTYKNLEIICINDGSTDNSENIIKKYMSNDKRIQLINQKNFGVSHSRNVGINLANGQYIMFVDSDDYIEKDYIEIMITSLLKSNSQIIISGNTKVTNNLKIKQSIYNKSLNTVFDITYPKELDNMFKTYEFNSACMQLISTEIIKNNNIKFEKNIKYGEDMLFAFICYTYSKRTSYIMNYGYNYISNPDSVMNNYSIESLNKYYLDNITTSEIMSKYITSKESSKLYYKTLDIFAEISYKLRISTDYKNYMHYISKARKEYDVYFKLYNTFKYGKIRQRIALFLLKHRLFTMYYLLRR